MCSAVMELGLGDWEDYRIALGGEQDDLALRLRAAQQLDDDAAARVVDCLDASGRPGVAVAVELSDARYRDAGLGRRIPRPSASPRT